MQTWLPEQESGGYDAGRVRAPLNDERARHHGKQAASPARLDIHAPPPPPPSAVYLRRRRQQKKNGEVCLTSITAGAMMGRGSPWAGEELVWRMRR